MTLDIVDHENKKVGSVDVSDEVFGGRVNADVMWESVVHANAAARRGTHQTKNRATVRAWAPSATRCGGTAAPCSALSRAATTTGCRRRSSAARCVRPSRRN